MTAQPAALPVVDDCRLKRVAPTVRGIRTGRSPPVDAGPRSGHGVGHLNWIANYIWGIAADILRDLYVRGKYRDVILPMTVLRRLDAMLEGSKQAVLDMKSSLDGA